MYLNGTSARVHAVNTGSHTRRKATRDAELGTAMTNPTVALQRPSSEPQQLDQSMQWPCQSGSTAP